MMIDSIDHIDALLMDEKVFLSGPESMFVDLLSFDLVDSTTSEESDTGAALPVDKKKTKRRRSTNTFVNKEGRVIRGKPCSFPGGCYNRAQSGGLCKSHGGGARCTVTGCNRSSQGHGKCRTHGGGRKCSFKGCSKGTQRNGYCFLHRNEAVINDLSPLQEQQRLTAL